MVPGTQPRTTSEHRGRMKRWIENKQPVCIACQPFDVKVGGGSSLSLAHVRPVPCEENEKKNTKEHVKTED